MYSDYRFLAKGVAQNDKTFSELEASTYLLASRNGEFYEICFLSRPMNPVYNEVKFIRDDEFMNMKKVTCLKEGMPGYKKYKTTIDKFLKENKTPTLADFRTLNDKLIAEQEKANSEEIQIGMN